MPAARYWRLIGLDSRGGGDLELSEVALYDGETRVDGSATLTSTFAPTTGSLANLKDDNTETTARFAAADVRLLTFAIEWDFGSSVEVNKLVFGSGSDTLGFVVRYELQVSEARLFWTTVDRGYSLALPTAGANSLRTVTRFEIALPAYVARFEAANGTKAVTNAVGTTSTFTFGEFVSIQNAQSAYGSSSLYFPGSQAAFATSTQGAPAKLNGMTSFTVEFWVYVTPAGDTRHLTGSWNGVEGWYVLKQNSGAVQFTMTRNSVTFTTVSASILLESNQWAHIAVERQELTTRVYVNGVVASTGTAPFSDGFVENTREWYLGSINGATPSSMLQGYIDEYAIYNAAIYQGVNFTPGRWLPRSEFTSNTSGWLRQASAAPTAISEYPVPEPTFRTGNPSSYDTYDGGPVSIVGTVKEYATPSNVPLRRRVRLYNELERRFVRETWSDDVTGNFAFTNMRQSKYTAIAYDHTGIYRALVVDQVEGVVP